MTPDRAMTPDSTATPEGAATNPERAATADSTVRGLGRTVPGWLLRLALLIAASAAVGVAMAGAAQVEVVSAVGLLTLLGVLGTALFPGTVLPLLTVLAVVLYRMASSGPLIDGALLVLVALLPAVHQLAGLAAAIPARAACELRALRPAVLRYLLAVLPVTGIVLVLLCWPGL